jgi:hypothetical protein
MEMTIRPSGDPDCDAQNNFRHLLHKGEAYSLILEETGGIRARVRVRRRSAICTGTSSPTARRGPGSAEYDAQSGKLQRDSTT